MSHQLKVTLQGVEPPIWRRLVVPSEFTLYQLHCAIQLVMGWDNSHLHDFEIKKQRYSVDPDDFGSPLDETTAHLCDVAKARTKIRYTYDFGDSWRHEIVVEKVIDDANVAPPVCTGGARACPPEDCGGPWGYADKLQTLAGPEDEDDEDNAELRDWMGRDFDPERFEVDAVNARLLEAFRPEPRRSKRK